MLWNYFESEAVAIQNVYVIGTTLAPYAAVNFNAGQLHGALYSNSITGYGEYHPQVRRIPPLPSWVAVLKFQPLFRGVT